MSNFWTLSDGKTAEQTTNFDAGSIDVLPDNTDVLAIVEEAGWKSGYEGAPDVISLRWSVLKPEALKNRKVFQKLKVCETDPKVSDKAKRMLMAIDTNAGGKLAKLEREPEDNDLMLALMNKPMVLKIKVWKMDGKEGNWVAAVSPAKKAAPAQKSEPVQQQPEPQSANLADLDDDIPF
jgi:hypothetical protein